LCITAKFDAGWQVWVNYTHYRTATLLSASPQLAESIRAAKRLYGRRPRCKGKESDFFAKRSGAAMYPAFECSRLAAGPDVIR
jgi:hypothetical protein